jgi:hydrogenase nickel insertion protein HypA
VRTARGVLTHAVHVVDGKVLRYRVQAPTDGFFADAAPLARLLANREFPSLDQARQALDQAILALDPACPIPWNCKMHEMSLAEGVLQLVEDTARRENAQRVKLVVLEIGRLSSVQPDALRFCFDAVTRGGIARDAALEIVDVPGAAGACNARRRCRCRNCTAPVRPAAAIRCSRRAVRRCGSRK